MEKNLKLTESIAIPPTYLYLEARDPKLGTEYVAKEMELVLKLGLLCSQSNPLARPSMRQMVQYLEGDAPMPEMTSIDTFDGGCESFDDIVMSYSTPLDKAFATFTQSSSSFEAFAHSSDAHSLLSGGR